MNKKGAWGFEMIAKIILILIVLFALIFITKYLNTIKEIVLGLG